jgi:transposase
MNSMLVAQLLQQLAHNWQQRGDIARADQLYSQSDGPALARKLLIALWRFVIDGVVPEGAVLKPAA